MKALSERQMGDLLLGPQVFGKAMLTAQLKDRWSLRSVRVAIYITRVVEFFNKRPGWNDRKKLQQSTRENESGVY